jgi:hypothetical protein
VQRVQFESVIARLAKLGARVGISPPDADERPAEYAARILNSTDPEDEAHDDVRFVVLALISGGRS